MKTLNWFLLFMLLASFQNSLFAQRSLEIGGYYGISLYQGDVTENYVQYNGHKKFMGAFLRYNMTPHLSFKMTYVHGTLGASDFYSSSRYDRGWSFSAEVNEFSTVGEWYFQNQFSKSLSGRPTFLFNPYLFAGIGYARIDANFKNENENQLSLVEADDKDLFLVFPIGLGIKGELSPRFKIGVEFGARATFSDYIDDIVTVTKANDWYWYAGVNVSIIIHKERYIEYRQRTSNRYGF
jgi:opacity protein-like surface antigen